MNRSVIAMMIGVTVVGMVTAEPQTPTYRRDVSPILQKNCWGCHSRTGKALLTIWTYEDAREYAGRIVGVVTGKAMPPQHYGLLGENGTLSKSDIDVIVRWAAAGAPEGSAQETRTSPDE